MFSGEPAVGCDVSSANAENALPSTVDQVAAGGAIVCALPEEQMSVDEIAERTVNPCTALCGALDDLINLIARMNSEQYCQHGLQGFSSSIGAHVRHCLDHVDALLLGIKEGEVRYDRRERSTQAEFDRDHAVMVVEVLQQKLNAIPSASLPSQLRVAAVTSPDGEEEICWSSGAREVLYVFHHTVHHLALMSAQAARMGVLVEAWIGRAPATLAADHED